MKIQQGFTLIELIVVIVILGILAATALPKLTDLSSDAKAGNADGAVAAFGSAAAGCYAKKKGACTAAEVQSYLNLDSNFAITGTCPTSVVIKYDSVTSTKAVKLDSTICNN